MGKIKSIHVRHLGGIDAAYQLSREYDQSKPTLVLVNAFTVTSEIFRAQLDSSLADSINLLAIEPLGHGQTATSREQWTYWDSAEMNLQVLEALGIRKAFALGLSQGGWIAVQMALMQPDRIIGVIPTGTSMDYESERTRQLQCWDGPTIVTGFVKQWTSSEPVPNFEPDNSYCDALIGVGFNKCSDEVRNYWRSSIKSVYKGENGRRKIRQAGINLAERGSLHLRLSDIRCPVLWLHGTEDVVFSAANAAEEIQLFTHSVDARLITIDGGAHFLSFTHPQQVNHEVLEFVKKYQSDEK